MALVYDKPVFYDPPSDMEKDYFVKQSLMVRAVNHY